MATYLTHHLHTLDFYLSSRLESQQGRNDSFSYLSFCIALILSTPYSPTIDLRGTAERRHDWNDDRPIHLFFALVKIFVI